MVRRRVLHPAEPPSNGRRSEGLSLGRSLLLLGAGLFAGVVGWAGREGAGAAAGSPRLSPTPGGHRPERRDLRLGASSAASSSVMLFIALSIVLVLIDSGHDHLANQQFVIGAIAVLVLFNLLGPAGDLALGHLGRPRAARPPSAAHDAARPDVAVRPGADPHAARVRRDVGRRARGSEGSSWWGISRDAWLVATVGAVVASSCSASPRTSSTTTSTSMAAGRPPGHGERAPPIITTNEPPRPAGA